MAEKEYIFGSISVKYNEDIRVDFRPEGNMAKDVDTFNYLMALARAIAGKEKNGEHTSN